jgi:hypothetical protein
LGRFVSGYLFLHLPNLGNHSTCRRLILGLHLRLVLVLHLGLVIVVSRTKW